MLVALLAWVLALAQAGPLYFSLPYRTALDDTQAHHLVRVEVNRLPYDIDFTLNSSPDTILSLALQTQLKTPSQRPDYRKNEQSVFGLFQFYGTQQADPRMDWKTRTAYNTYYFARDFLERLSWINLNGVRQVDQEGALGAAEGSFNFGPQNTDSEVLRSFKKYSKYMGETIISFRGNLADEDGQVVFGAFPPEAIRGEHHKTSLDYLGESAWIVTTTALHLSHRKAQPTPLYRETVKLKLTLSEKSLVLPLIAATAIEKAFPRCSFQDLSEEGRSGKWLVCKDLKREELQTLSFDFSIRESQLPLSVRFTDLELSEKGGRSVMAVRTGKEGEYQIGQTILRQYAIGIDYREGKLMYGPLAEEPLMSRGVLLKGFLAVNALLFLVSAALVAMERQLRERLKVAVRQELGLSEESRPAKANSYELASVTEQTLSE